MKEGEVDWACNRHGRDEKCIHKPEGKRQLGRPMDRWEVSIKINLKINKV
jgi:hypothetical protein